MTKPSSSNASGNSCANSVGPPTTEEIAHIIRLLREAGAKVVDLSPADIEALIREWL
jgi:hypothetical protein